MLLAKIWLLPLLQVFPPNQVLWCEPSSWKVKWSSRIPGAATGSVSTFLHQKLLLCASGQGLETSHSDFTYDNSQFSQLHQEAQMPSLWAKTLILQPTYSEELGRLCPAGRVLHGGRSHCESRCANKEVGDGACFKENSLFQGS